MLALSPSKQDLLDIVAAASTMDERLSKGFLPIEGQVNDEIIHARLEQWCQVVAKGDWEQLRRRLAWDGLDEEMVRPILGVVHVPEGLPLPAWADTLSEALSLAASFRLDEARERYVGVGIAPTLQDPSHLPFLDAGEPYPFEELLVPFVLLARRRCAAQAGDAYRLLCEEAHVTLQRSLLQTLTTYAAQALQVRFVYRATRMYGSLMQKLLDPKYLRDGIERSIQLELLGRAVLPLEGPLRDKGELTRWWSVFAAERQAMMQGGCSVLHCPCQQ